MDCVPSITYRAQIMQQVISTSRPMLYFTRKATGNGLNQGTEQVPSTVTPITMWVWPEAASKGVNGQILHNTRDPPWYH